MTDSNESPSYMSLPQEATAADVSWASLSAGLGMWHEEHGHLSLRDKSAQTLDLGLIEEMYHCDHVSR